MKMKLLTLFIALLSSQAFAQIIDFPDANFKNKLLSSQSGVPIAYGCNGGSFALDVNGDGEIEVSEALLVCSLFVNDANISDLTGLEYFTNLKRFKANNNNLTEVDLTPLVNLKGIGLLNNQLSSLNITGLSNLNNMSCSNNLLTSLDMTGLSNVKILVMENNQFNSLDFTGASSLWHLRISNNLLTTLDISGLPELREIDVSSNALTTLYLKNGTAESLNFENNPDLEYVCADGNQLFDVSDKINQYGLTNCHTNSLCSFTPGNPTYMITGNIKYDEQEDGCDPSDQDYPSLRMTVSDGTNSGDVYGDVNGNYQYTVQAGDFLMSPQLDNSAIFAIDPIDVMVSFPAQGSPYVQDFCVTPDGVHPDLAITLSPYDFYVFPGEFTEYTITITNNGNQTQSGSVELNYDEEISDFSEATPAITSSSQDLLTWDFSDLRPFESRDIVFVLYINGEVDTPPVVVGDIIEYTASIITTEIDDTPVDNTTTLQQMASFTTLSTEAFELSDYFKIYPNPASHLVTIQIKPGIEILSTEIYNTRGQLVTSVRDRLTTALDITVWPSGIYFVLIQTDRGMYRTRFIKR